MIFSELILHLQLLAMDPMQIKEHLFAYTCTSALLARRLAAKPPEHYMPNGLVRHVCPQKIGT